MRPHSSSYSTEREKHWWPRLGCERSQLLFIDDVSRKRNEKPSRGAVSWSVWRTCVLESLALSVAALLIRTFQPNPCFWDDVNSRDYFILDRRFPKRSSTPLRHRWSVFQRGPHTAPSMGSSPETLVGFLLTGTLWNAVLRPSPNQSERVLPPTPSRLWAHAVAVCSLYKQLLFYHWNFGFFSVFMCTVSIERFTSVLTHIWLRTASYFEKCTSLCKDPFWLSGSFTDVVLQKSLQVPPGSFSWVERPFTNQKLHVYMLH